MSMPQTSERVTGGPSSETPPRSPPRSHGPSRHSRAAHTAAEPWGCPGPRPARSARARAGGRWPRPHRSGPCRSPVPRVARGPPGGRAWARGKLPADLGLVGRLALHEYLADRPAVEPGHQQHPATVLLPRQAVGEPVALAQDHHQRSKVGVGRRADLGRCSHEVQPSDPVEPSTIAPVRPPLPACQMAGSSRSRDGSVKHHRDPVTDQLRPWNASAESPEPISRGRSGKHLPRPHTAGFLVGEQDFGTAVRNCPAPLGFVNSGRGRRAWGRARPPVPALERRPTRRAGPSQL